MVIDLVALAGCVYTLMPGDIAANFALFFVVFMATILLGGIRHAPGAGSACSRRPWSRALGAAGRSDVIAGLALYCLV